MNNRILIIIGWISIIEGIIYAICPLIAFIFYALSREYGANYSAGIFGILSIPGLVIGILSFISGLYTFKRRRWKSILASSITIFLPSIILLLFFIGEIISAITMLRYLSIDIWYEIRHAHFWLIIPIAIAIINLVLIIKAKKSFYIQAQEPSEVFTQQSNVGVKKRNKKLLILIPIVVVALVAMLLGVYFANQELQPYKLITFNKGVNFYFEYPTHFYLDAVYKLIPGKYSGGLHFIERKAECGGLSVSVYIFSKDAESAATDLVLHAYDVERSVIEINGIDGELVIRHWESGGVEVCGGPVSERTVYFDYNGLLWEIELFSMDENESQAKTDFEHIVHTF
jgi:hypothetical protein